MDSTSWPLLSVSEREARAMRLAVELASRAGGQTSPNPVVGCVLLSPSGELVGQGWHAAAGGPHAEVVALNDAGGKARGATAVVTLEPCDREGRTPPCVAALLDAGVARVVVAVLDPTLATGGVAALRRAGVSVEVGVGADTAQRGNRPWLTAVRRGRPFVTWKFAATLDGRSAAADGTSRWITSPQAREDVHRLRAMHDTVMVGVGTVLTDDPALTVRLPGFTGRQPHRVVVDSCGRTPSDAQVHAGPAGCWIATAADVGIDPQGRVDLQALLTRLFDRGCRAILLEGGPTLAGAFLASGYIDQIVAYLAPAFLGSGPAALGDCGIGTITDLRRLSQPEYETVGGDLRLTADVKPKLTEVV